MGVGFKLIVSWVQDLTGSGLKPGKNGCLSRDRPRWGREDLRQGTTFVGGCKDLLRTFGFLVRERP